MNEAQAPVEAHRRVGALDVDRHRQAGVRPFAHDLAEQRRAVTLAAMTGHQRDIDQADLIGPAIDIQPPDRLARDPVSCSTIRNSQFG